MNQTEDRKKAPSPRTDTRERVLSEAAALFLRQGYKATTTRQIADALGIRQPSLFHHFPNKQAILDELFSLSLDEAVVTAAEAAKRPGSPSQRLRDYLVWDLTNLLSKPFNFSGLYTDELLRQPELSHWGNKLHSLYSSLESLVGQAVSAGEFAPIDPVLGRMLIAAITITHLQYCDRQSGYDADALAKAAAMFAIAGLASGRAGIPFKDS
jgi:AcrR family transcriptional regulator